MFWKFVRLKNPLPVRLNIAINRKRKIIAQFFATGISSLELPLRFTASIPFPAKSHSPDKDA